MNKFQLPKTLKFIIGNDKIDFLIPVKLSEPKALSYVIIPFSLLWLSFFSFIICTILIPFFNEEAIEFSINEGGESINLGSLKIHITPLIILVLFFIIGIGLLIWGLIGYFRKEIKVCYVGTENKIITFVNGNIKSYRWEQFTGNIKLYINEKKLSLEMNKDKKKKNTSSKTNPNFLFLTNINNLTEIEGFCNNRIKKVNKAK